MRVFSFLCQCGAVTFLSSYRVRSIHVMKLHFLFKREYAGGSVVTTALLRFALHGCLVPTSAPSKHGTNHYSVAAVGEMPYEHEWLADEACALLIRKGR